MLLLASVVSAVALGNAAARFTEKIVEAGAPESLCDTTVKQLSGYYRLTDNKTDDHYFYWMFESRSQPKTDPFILWLTGGPGCSGHT